MTRIRTLFPLLALATAGCDLASGATQSSAPQNVARPEYLATAVGRVDSESEARQLVASADGVIRKLHVQRGQRVEVGQLLLSVDCSPRDAAAMARSAEADRLHAAADTVLAGARGQEIEAALQNVKGAEAVRADAADRLSQAQLLVDDGFISRRELAARENALTSADAALQAAQAKASLVIAGPRQSERREALSAARAAKGEARAANALASQCDLRSPIAGEVLQIFRREGEFSGASQGTALIAVGDMANLIVRAEINERDAALVNAGQAADIWIEGQDRRWSGRVGTLAQVMGRRSARSLDPTDRFDRDVREAFITFDGPLPPALVGLRVMVGVRR